VEAIRIIQSEHLALSAVLYGMLHVVRSVRFARVQPDFHVLNAMMTYIAQFPEKFHHPKEEMHLFRMLRERNPDSAALLDRLTREHRNGSDRVVELADSLRRYEEEGFKRFGPFATAAASYAAFHFDHARAEEFKAIPLAESFLKPADWRDIDEAFLAHTDPLVDADVGMRCDALFREIVSIVPPAEGVRRTRGAL
jgi:hemerythrin-like domain-containing protein